MVCPSCHAQNIEGADECANCGAPLYGLDLPGGQKSPPAPPFIHEALAVLPRRPIAGVGPADPVGLVVRYMQSHNTNYVLVLEEGRLLGIITSWDVLHKLAGRGIDLNAVACRQIMTADPTCLHEEDSLALALNVMGSGGFRHVPILKDGLPDRVLDVNDLFRHISPNLV